VAFVVRPPAFVEATTGEPREVALANALGKARAVERRAAEIVLGVDTVVALGGRLYDKPVDEREAQATLRALSGATHTVVSGIALIGDDGERSGVASTAVTFRALDEATIDWYAATGEWRDRAGGYAIQGAGCALVAGISGDWTNVVGLPVSTFLDLNQSLIVGNNRFTAADP